MELLISMKERLQILENENKVLRELLAKEKTLNKSKIRLLAGASHDLRSPLTNIQLSASLIEHYYHRIDEKKVFFHLAKIRDAVKHFTVVLNNYLLKESGEDDQVTG